LPYEEQVQRLDPDSGAQTAPAPGVSDTRRAELAAAAERAWARLDQRFGLPVGTMQQLSPRTIEELLQLPQGMGAEHPLDLDSFAERGRIGDGAELSGPAAGELVAALGLPPELARARLNLTLLRAASQPAVEADAAPTGALGEALATLGYDGTVPPTPALLGIAEAWLGVIGLIDMSGDVSYYHELERIVQQAEPMQVGPQWTIRVPGVDPDEPSLASAAASGLAEELVGDVVSQGVGGVLTVISLLNNVAAMQEQYQLEDWCVALSRGRRTEEDRELDALMRRRVRRDLLRELSLAQQQMYARGERRAGQLAEQQMHLEAQAQAELERMGAFTTQRPPDRMRAR